MKRKLLRIIEIVLAVVLVVSLAMVARTELQYSKGAATYEEAFDAARPPKLTVTPAPAVREEVKMETQAQPDAGTEPEPDPNLVLLAAMKIDELRRTNSDVLGWITIPDTVISYPVLQAQDNDYYLKHTWQKESSIVGSVFMDCRSKAELTDFNTIIYGHNMRDGSMFGTMSDYLELEHWREHPSVYLVCGGVAYRYDIFAAYEASVTGPVYQFEERDEAGREAFIAECLRLSAIDTGIVPTADDTVLTLSTCTGRGYQNRWVVQAVQAESYAK